MFLIFNFTLEYLKILQSSEPLHAKMNPTSCLFGSRFAQNPVFLLAGTLLFDEKIRQRVTLFWFGLRDVGILQIFYSRVVIQRIIVDSPIFLEIGFVKKIVVCAHTTLQRYFCMKRIRTLNSFQIFKVKIKKITLRLIQSGRTLPLI